MPRALHTLEPSAVWRHFEQLCSIPRPSGHEAQVAAHILGLAHAWGLEASTDAIGNVFIKKPARRGMDGRRTVVLQAHLDMVPQQSATSTHNFVTDPIQPSFDGTLVRAMGTTLGADNGIGLATALAVLESRSLVHGPIEVLFTVDEEAGMTGARNLQPGFLTGDILLNLDSEDEGEICIGCAGGADAKAVFAYVEVAAPADGVGYRVTVSGLKGGHSGVDIHLGRGNANKVLARLLYGQRDTGMLVSSFVGGTLRNAIARDATATVYVPRDSAARFQRSLAAATAVVQAELRVADPDLQVSVDVVTLPTHSMDAATTGRLLGALVACPHGIFAMVPGMGTVTETSTNLAIVVAGGGSVAVTNMLRSSVDSKKDDVAAMLRAVYELAGADVTISGSYPGWQPAPDAPLLARLQSIYAEMFHQPARVTATHGGLECGLIRAVYPHMEALSIGPTIRFPHSPDEQVDVASVQRFWGFLVEVLRHIPSHG
jgi:dipeptidase D